MAKPKSSNRSIRLPDEMWAWLAAEADRRQNSVNGLVGELLMVARLKADERAAGEMGTQRPAKPTRAGSVPAPHSSAPKLAIPIGPVERKPGEMLKKR